MKSIFCNEIIPVLRSVNRIQLRYHQDQGELNHGLLVWKIFIGPMFCMVLQLLVSQLNCANVLKFLIFSLINEMEKTVQSIAVMKYSSSFSSSSLFMNFLNFF